MDLFVVVSTQLLLFLQTPVSDWLFDISIRIFAADHKANLSGGVCWNGGVCIFNGRKDFLAGFLQLCDEGEVQPLVLG
jgi:hypothetical protein